MTGKRALLLLNRHARSGRDAFRAATDALRARGLVLTVEASAKPSEYASVLRRRAREVDLVVIGGGDGTLNAAVDGLVDTQLPLGLLPLGTANDLARTLGVPKDLERAADIIAAGSEKRIDVGCVNGKHYFNVASLGLSVRLTARLQGESKRRFGALAYALTAARVLSEARAFPAEIHHEGGVERVRTLQIAVGNGRYYGGGMAVVDDAAIDDQRLDLYSLEMDGWWQMLPILPRMRKGRHVASPKVRALFGREFEVVTPRSRSINTDGEVTTRTPARFHVVPRALSVLVPAEATASS